MKTQKAVTTFVVGGVTFDKRDTIGQLALALKDQKAHKLSSVLHSMKGKVKDPKYRVQILTMKGKAKRAFRIEKDRKKDLIRMQITKRTASKPKVKKATVAAPQTQVA